MPSFVPSLVPPGTLTGRVQPSITGSTVGLRPWTASDAPVLVTAYADPDIQQWHTRSVDPAEALALVDAWHTGWRQETKAEWAVTDSRTGEIAGRIGLRAIDLPNGLAEIAYWVLPTARRRRVATAAVNLLTRWAFEEIGLHRIELNHSTRNTRSCRVAALSGFALEGTKRAALQHADGWHDMHLHARLATDRLEGTAPSAVLDAVPAHTPVEAQTKSMPPSTSTDWPVM